MECKCIRYFLFVLVCFTDDLTGDRIYFPNLPVGAYKLKFRGAFICNESINYPLSLKLHTSRISKTKTVLTGNVVAKVPLDDNLTLNFTMAKLDAIGGWKYNAFVYSHSGACSTLKRLMGEVWTAFVRTFEPVLLDCPMAIENYTMNGFDLSLIEKMNIPKQFFYGTYKLKTLYTNKQGVPVGCLYIVLEFVRPWEYTV